MPMKRHRGVQTGGGKRRKRWEDRRLGSWEAWRLKGYEGGRIGGLGGFRGRESSR